MSACFGCEVMARMELRRNPDGTVMPMMIAGGVIHRRKNIARALEEAYAQAGHRLREREVQPSGCRETA